MRPVSFYGTISGFIRLSINSVGTKHSQNPKTKTEAGTKTPHPSQSEGSISRWLGGILKGKTPNGSELFSPSLRTFLPEQESTAPLASACKKSRLENRRKGYNRVSIPTSKYHPIRKPSACPPACSLSHGEGHRGLPGRASSLPEGAIFRQLLRFHIGFLRIGSGCCESLWQKSKIIASSHRPGAFLRLVSALPQIQKPRKAWAFRGIFLFQKGASGQNRA